jgi:CBS domain containing-hemolysin-like protein
MPTQYARLLVHKLESGSSLSRPTSDLPERVGLDNPALDTMTDFRRVTAFIATPGDRIGQAEARMHRQKVKLLFVMDSNDQVAGLVTTTDIYGEKPMQVMQSRRIHHDEVVVSDIMTPVDQLEAIDFEDLARARIGNVLETLKASGRQHALVLEHKTSGNTVRGLLSLTMLCKQLGVALETAEVARAFIERTGVRAKIPNRA